MSEFRIVSLLPAATELIYELGLGDQLVGRSHECDYPQAARLLPVCSEPAYSVAGHAGDIHNATSGVEALSIFNLDVDTLRNLQPTHIVTQSQCDVCAVSKDELKLKIHDLFDYEVELIDFSPDSL
ncbi:MAG: cobalamin-binding protein, partial [Candidatus Marinimicrobia bacterium]|nr:cobalamin-binding protein [Candidatus Neomarinimicrobiota bacterium]